MKSVLAGSAAGVVLLVCVSMVSAQSLGDLARREEERRKTLATPSKVYTNQSLGPEGVPAALGVERSAEPQPAEVPADPSTPDDAALAADAAVDPAADSPGGEPGGSSMTEAEWRQRVADARQAQARARVLADALQSRINVLAADFVNRDDPAQRDVVAADRQRALDELARVNDEIEQHQQSVIDIQEEARRAGVPAGWVR